MDKKQDIEIATPAATKSIVNRFGFSLKKSLGQNFMTDKNILHKMVSAAELDEQEGVLEIGPGIGALTQVLARTANQVTAIEIDQRLLPVLNETLAAYTNVSVVHGDVLKLDLRDLIGRSFSKLPIHVVANLPYYVTTPIIMCLLEQRLPIRNIVVLIQKEVAQRMTAGPGGKDYGSLSIAVQYYCEPELVSVVPRTVFVPRPNVESAIMKLRRREHPPVRVENEEFFFEVVRSAFAQRRKTIFNNLAAAYMGKERKEELRSLLLDCGIEPSRRGETLSIAEFARISVQLESAMSLHQ